MVETKNTRKVDKKAVKAKVQECIRAGLNYAQTKKKLEEEDIKYPALSKTFYTWKEQIYPSAKVDAALEKGKETREDREAQKSTKERRAKWTSQKQRAADESKLADLINEGLYHGVFPFCKSQELRVEDVKEINLGGGIVGSVLYFFPDVNLDHPLIVVTTRLILFYIKFRSICSKIREKVEEYKGKIPSSNLGGIKADWLERGKQ